MTTIIYANLMPLLGLIFMVWLVHFNPTFKRQQSRIFMMIVLVNIVLIVATSLDYIFALNSEELEFAWLYRRIMSFLNFAASPIIPYGLLRIFSSRKRPFYFYLPLLLNALLCFSSIFAPVVFFITTDNKYGRGPLFLVPFGISVIYVALLAVESVKCRLKSKRVESFFLAAVILALVLCFYLETALRYRFLDWTCCAICVMAYYVLLTIHSSIVDPLTGAYNRLMYTKDLTQIDGSKRCLIALMDINDFKQVNDTYGHDAGDNVLIQFVDLLTRNLGGSSDLFRIGGDEFVVLSKKLTLPEFEHLLDKLREVTASHNIRFACGITEYLPEKDLQESLRQADQAMYQDKRQMKNGSAAEPEA